MRRGLIAMAASVALGAWGQDITRDQYAKLKFAVDNQTCKATPEIARSEISEMLGRFGVNYYSGRSALVYLKENKYKDLTIFDLAIHYCIELPKPLGPIDQWRYDSCRSDAAKAPTSQGVYAGMQVCREKFGQ